MNILLTLLRRRPRVGRGLGIGWLVSFALGYAVRDLMDEDSQIRKRLQKKKGQANISDDES